MHKVKVSDNNERTQRRLRENEKKGKFLVLTELKKKQFSIAYRETLFYFYL